MVARNVLSLGLAALFGFLGGAAATGVDSLRADSPQLVQARRFELLDESGMPVAYWGTDPDRHVQLVFKGKKQNDLARFGLSPSSLPFLELFGAHGKGGIVLRLYADELPLLAMNDAEWEGRVLLGSLRQHSGIPEEDYWGLWFLAPPNLEAPLLSLGVSKNLKDPKEGTYSGHVTIRNGKAYWQAP
jgi:hypothetical protein